jgi:hypothetical protein
MTFGASASTTLGVQAQRVRVAGRGVSSAGE